MKASVAEFLAKLPASPDEKYPEGAPFVKAFEHGTMYVELFAPQTEDRQMPHEQDELYVVVAGSGEFVRGEETLNFAAGDVLFVPARVPHRFVNFTQDFVTWVIFYGQHGGEKP